MKHDPSVAQAYLADDFRGVSSKGKVMSKSNLLSEIKKDTDAYTSTKNGKVDVRVFGGQFAVATGTSTEVGKAKDGQAFKRSFPLDRRLGAAQRQMAMRGVAGHAREIAAHCFVNATLVSRMQTVNRRTRAILPCKRARYGRC